MTIENDKQFWVIWFYAANYEAVPVIAENAKEAKEMVTRFYSDDFHKKSITYVFEGKPALIIANQKEI